LCSELQLGKFIQAAGPSVIWYITKVPRDGTQGCLRWRFKTTECCVHQQFDRAGNQDYTEEKLRESHRFPERCPGLGTGGSLTLVSSDQLRNPPFRTDNILSTCLKLPASQTAPQAAAILFHQGLPLSMLASIPLPLFPTHTEPKKQHPYGCRKCLPLVSCPPHLSVTAECHSLWSLSPAFHPQGNKTMR
jgi:hypothetical protein